MRRVLFIFLAASALVLAACAHKPPMPAGSANATVPASGAGAQSTGAAGASTSASEGANTAQGAAAAPAATARTIHFAFDSSVIDAAGTAIVTANAKYLAAHSQVHVRLEGNTDERGSPEYNIGLGWRRAESVRQAMLLQGVSASQITMVSYGEERPVDPAHNPAAWAKNRRVDIVYLNN